ncbi:MAG: hypothetical protein HY046_08985, partial [Acidobacteria bacterium]|nr:hypothetical protein [Acidobacteriota bacterium]
MTELETLFLILVAVYLTQCVSWVAPQTVLFSKNFRGSWRVPTPEFELGAWQTKAAFANPLPFFAGLIASSSEPLVITPEGILPS